MAGEDYNKNEENYKNYKNYFTELKGITEYVEEEGVEPNAGSVGRDYTLTNGLQITSVDMIGQDSFILRSGNSSMQLEWESGKCRLSVIKDGELTYSISANDENLILPETLDGLVKELVQEGKFGQDLAEKIQGVMEGKKAKEQQERAETIKENKENFNNYFETLGNIEEVLNNKDGVKVESFENGEKKGHNYELGEDTYLIVTEGEGEKSYELYGPDSAMILGYDHGSYDLDTTNGENSYSISHFHEKNLLPESLGDLLKTLTQGNKINPELSTLIQNLIEEAEKEKEAQKEGPTQVAPEQEEQQAEPEKEEKTLLPSAVEATKETRFGKITEMAKGLFAKVKEFLQGKDKGKEEKDQGQDR